MSEIRYPVWWEPPENTNGKVESDRLAHVYEQTDGFPGDVAIARVFKPEHARRIAAALNATKGIPTETLEAGVVVVPVEVATAALPLIERQREWAFQFAAEYQQMLGDEDVDSKALVQRRETKIAEAWAWDALAVALSRFQQNGGGQGGDISSSIQG